jgi:hypothetical protein
MIHHDYYHYYLDCHDIMIVYPDIIWYNIMMLCLLHHIWIYLDCFILLLRLKLRSMPHRYLKPERSPLHPLVPCLLHASNLQTSHPWKHDSIQENSWVASALCMPQNWQVVKSCHIDMDPWNTQSRSIGQGRHSARNREHMERFLRCSTRCSYKTSMTQRCTCWAALDWSGFPTCHLLFCERDDLIVQYVYPWSAIIYQVCYHKPVRTLTHPTHVSSFSKHMSPKKKQILPRLRLSFLTAREGYHSSPITLSPRHNLIIQETGSCKMPTEFADDWWSTTIKSEHAWSNSRQWSYI